MPHRLQPALDAWREAERRLDAMAPDDPQRPSQVAEVDALRDRYHAIFEEVVVADRARGRARARR